MLLAGAVGGLVTIKMFWSNIISKVRGQKAEDDSPEGEAPNVG